MPDNEREKSPEKEAAAGEEAEMVRGATDASLHPTSPTPNMEKVKQLIVTFDHRRHLTAGLTSNVYSESQNNINNVYVIIF